MKEINPAASNESKIASSSAAYQWQYERQVFHVDRLSKDFQFEELDNLGVLNTESFKQL